VRIDLHLHSSASDGQLAPDALVRRARARGLDVVALTDHDSAAGVPEALQAAPPGLRVIPGIEISARHRGAEIHVLGYGFDPEHPRILEYQGRAAHRREDRMERMITRLVALGLPVTMEEVRREAGADVRSLGRPHLARALVRRGHVRGMGEAFHLYLANGGPAFVETDFPSAADAAGIISEAGGVTVWAHPAAPEVEAWLDELVAAGFEGVEAYRPDSLPLDAALLRERAAAHGLLLTGGSDWHGPFRTELGTFWVTPEEIGPFLERVGVG
jgi:3',5'-nucleoside bisphosphate phosphatase